MKTLLLTIAVVLSPLLVEAAENPLRVATFNVSFHRRNSGDLIRDLESNSVEATRVATILRTVRPDIVLLNEVDFDDDGQAVRLFQEKYLQSSHLPGTTQPLTLPHVWIADVNTGRPSGKDLNHDGRDGGPADAFGFGWFPGQYGMVVLSRFPFDTDSVRTFQKVRWHAMPEARQPIDPQSRKPWYSADEWDVLRLSSKSHWDIPVDVHGTTLHILAAHPTPPAFDGPEDRNGRRNADEIRFWADYLSEDRAGWIHDDAGRVGGLAADAHFCVLGDLNADPADGSSVAGAIQQLLNHPRVNSQLIPQSQGAVVASEEQGGRNKRHQGPPEHDTADFSDRVVGNLRVDYVLPSQSLETVNGGVYWPEPGTAGAELIDCSDHRLVWMDLHVPGTTD